MTDSDKRAIVRLTPNTRHRVLSGHPWIFSNEILSVDGHVEPGDIVEVRDLRDKFVGKGYINPQSAITVRMLTREDQRICEAFIKERVREAVNYRETVYGEPGPLGSSPKGYRLVFSEGDFLPGLIVDLFGGYLVFQTLTLGIDKWKDTIVEALRDFVEPKGIYERNDAPVRELEGLTQQARFIGRPFDPLVEMDENGVTIVVDTQKGQKTGYFLDQTDNRLAIRAFCTEKTVLDAFSYSGGFGMSAALGGACKVVCVDVSDAALDLARAGATRNGFAAKMTLRNANVFDVLREFETDGLRFDVVVLDPPAFARSRKMSSRALAGYKEINLRAMRIVEEGGFVCTSSCSQHVAKDEFDQMLEEAAVDSKKTVRIVERRGQRLDHPVLAGVPETEYLKFRICQVFNSR